MALNVTIFYQPAVVKMFTYVVFCTLRTMRKTFCVFSKFYIKFSCMQLKRQGANESLGIFSTMRVMKTMKYNLRKSLGYRHFPTRAQAGIFAGEDSRRVQGEGSRGSWGRLPAIFQIQGGAEPRYLVASIVKMKELFGQGNHGPLLPMSAYAYSFHRNKRLYSYIVYKRRNSRYVIVQFKLLLTKFL